jgi:hypothetical protein
MLATIVSTPSKIVSTPQVPKFRLSEDSCTTLSLFGGGGSCSSPSLSDTSQSKPSQNDMKKMEKLLQYVSKHRNIGIRFYASNMTLQLMSNASFLCHPKAASVVGLLAYLGSPHGINGPLSCNSKMISCVVASVAEAERASWRFPNSTGGCAFS